MKKLSNDFFINSIVFDIEPIKAIKQKADNVGKQDNSNILLNKILSTLDDFVIEFNSMQFFDDYIAQNIYNIVDYIRDNYVYNNIEIKQKVYESCNKILSGVNNYFGANSNSFYLDQFNARGIFLDCSNKVNEFNIPDTVKDDIRSSLSFDNFFYDILVKKRKDISDRTIETCIMNTMFMYSVNYFYIELCNSKYSDFDHYKILENNLALKEILLANKKIINSLNFKLGYDKKYAKTKCLIKSTNQLLNDIRWS